MRIEQNFGASPDYSAERRLVAGISLDCTPSSNTILEPDPFNSQLKTISSRTIFHA
jgi:hypothetical protein